VDPAAFEEQLAALHDAGRLAEAATTAIQGYGPQILGYLCAVMQQESDAREVFAQFCEDLWRGLAGFRRECSFRTWSYKLARHAMARFARDPYRRRGRRLETAEISELAASIHSAPLPSAGGDRLARARGLLGADDQTLLILRIDRKLRWSEVAEILSDEGRPIDQAALRKRFERIKDQLRRLIADPA
jgi:RNA polymerase sigma-70 factor (ECF subfamily)